MRSTSTRIGRRPRSRRRIDRWTAAVLLSLPATYSGCLFASGPRPDRMHPTLPVAAGSPEFLLALAGTLNAPVRRGGSAELLVNGAEFLPSLIEAIDRAQKSVHVTTYVWEPDLMGDLVLDALERAAARDVEVRLLLDGHGARNLPSLMDAGVRVFEYEPTLIHSKTLVVDGIWSIVGSANLDLRSAQLNEENVLAIRDADFAERLEEVFLADLRKAREVELEEWAQRGPVARAQEMVGSLMEEQL